MKRDFNTSAMNISNMDNNIPKELQPEIKKSNHQSFSSKGLKSSNSYYKPIFGKENLDIKNKSQMLLNFSNVVGNNNNTECSFLTCIDNDTKVEIKTMMNTMKNEILEMYTNMIAEIRKDFRKKCE